jgi:hypothetical protein
MQAKLLAFDDHARIIAGHPSPHSDVATQTVRTDDCSLRL